MNWLREAATAHELGVPAVCCSEFRQKRRESSGAYAANGIVQQAVRLLKKELPQLLVITDVCLCEYMEHGHCGIVQRGKADAKILNDPTLKLLAQSAASHAEAGADMVAPSDMMDGRVRVIRELLDKKGFTETPIMSYAAKFASLRFAVARPRTAVAKLRREICAPFQCAATERALRRRKLRRVRHNRRFR